MVRLVMTHRKPVRGSELVPRSHQPWTTQEDALLARRVAQGVDMWSLGKVHGRSYAAIRSRLIKLGLIELLSDARPKRTQEVPPVKTTARLRLIVIPTQHAAPTVGQDTPEWPRPRSGHRGVARPLPPIPVGVIRRILDQTVEAADGCWDYTGLVGSNGYGRVYFQGSEWRTHRVMAAWWYGGIAVDQDPDHLCRRRSCCRPDHLEIVDRSTNVKRGLRGQPRTHCKRGHLLTDDNVIWMNGTTNRTCLTCRREYLVAWREQQSRVS